MAAALQEVWQTEWAVTPQKVAEAIDRIIAVAAPARVIAFGSRVRGQFRPDSDLDLAVVLDRIDPNEEIPVRSSLFRGLPLDIDLLVTDAAQYERFKIWPGSVHHEIEKYGVVLYDRGRDARANPDALAKIGIG